MIEQAHTRKGTAKEEARNWLAEHGYGNGKGANNLRNATEGASRLSKGATALGYIAGGVTWGTAAYQEWNKTQGQPFIERAGKSAISGTTTTTGAATGAAVGAFIGSRGVAAAGGAIGAAIPVLDVVAAPGLAYVGGVVGGAVGGAAGGFIGGKIGDITNALW